MGHGMLQLFCFVNYFSLLNTNKTKSGKSKTTFFCKYAKYRKNFMFNCPCHKYVKVTFC